MLIIRTAIKWTSWQNKLRCGHPALASKTVGCPDMPPGQQDRQRANRIFYLSIPPSIFTAVAACASEAASTTTGWNRVIVEKPFGRDLASFQQLSKELSVSLSEDQMYRIDHYLGKELIENLTARPAPSPMYFGSASLQDQVEASLWETLIAEHETWCCCTL